MKADIDSDKFWNNLWKIWNKPVTVYRSYNGLWKSNRSKKCYKVSDYQKTESGKVISVLIHWNGRKSTEVPVRHLKKHYIEI